MKQPYLDPAILCPLLWVSVIGAALASGLDFYPLSDAFFLYMPVAVTTFSLTAVAGHALALNLEIARIAYARLSALRVQLTPVALIRLHLCCMVLSLMFQCLDHQLIAGGIWWQPSGLIIYRLAVSEFGVPVNFRFTAVLNYFFFALAPLLWMYWGEITKRLRLACVLCLTFFVYLSTSRASFFTIVLLTVLFILHFRPRIELVGLVALLLFFAFQLIGALVGKSGSAAFWIYLYAPTFALDQIIQGIRTDVAGAFYTFYPLQPLLGRLGFIAERQSNNLSYYATPYRTNVYTVFGPLILDYGLTGSIIWIGIFGTISGLIRGMQRRVPTVPFMAFLSSLSITILLLGVFHDYYTTAGYVWFTLVFSTALFPRVLPAGRRSHAPSVLQTVGRGANETSPAIAVVPL